MMEKFIEQISHTENLVSENTAVNQKCPLCGNDQDNYVVRRWINEYDAVRCDKCALIFARPMKSNIEIYDQSYDTDGEFSHLLYRARALKSKGKKVLAWPYKTLLKYINRKGISPKNIFEVGCGDGHFVYFMKSSGYHASGCDVSASACRQAKELFDIDVIHSDFNDVTVPDESQDIILGVELIEHLGEPMEFLKTAYSKLKSGGYLFLSTPNADTKWPFYWTDSRVSFPPFHLTIWSEKSFSNAAKKVNFVMEDFIKKPVPFRWEFMNCHYSLPRLLFESSVSFLKGEKGVTIFSIMRKPLINA
jgi:2-polyprenyl-3-methyl-5-hydroxy-6-metoxy-1,4-benzoquinol methylase